MLNPGKETKEEYLLTGATGFLGSYIMAALLKEGRKIIIFGRGDGNNSLKERIAGLLTWFGMDEYINSLELYEINFLSEKMGLDSNSYYNLTQRKLKVIHCASDTSFVEKKRQKVMAANVESLNELLNFVNSCKQASLYFVSTAYAAGIDKNECNETVIGSLNFTNVYEESKAVAEKKVTEFCEKNGISYTIVRPSIVYGDSVSGRALKFNALYYPVKFMQFIRDIYLEDIKNNGGIKAAKCGIFFNEDGTLNLPVKIFVNIEGRINLIPVDYFTRIFLQVIDKPCKNRYYHITSEEPSDLKTLALYTMRFLNLTGLEVIDGSLDKGKQRNPAEELYDHFIKAYLPYISDIRFFTRENTNKYISDLLPPVLSYEIFERCMRYAVDTDWKIDTLKTTYSRVQ